MMDINCHWSREIYPGDLYAGIYLIWIFGKLKIERAEDDTILHGLKRFYGWASWHGLGQNISIEQKSWCSKICIV